MEGRWEKNCSEDSRLYDKAREHFTSALSKEHFPQILERYLSDDWYREAPRSGQTERSKSGTVLQKDRTENTSQRQQNVNLSQKTFTTAGTSATAKQAALQKAQEWHSEYVRRQRDNKYSLAATE